MIVQEKIVESKQQKKEISEVCLFVTTQQSFWELFFLWDKAGSPERWNFAISLSHG